MANQSYVNKLLWLICCKSANIASSIILKAFIISREGFIHAVRAQVFFIFLTEHLLTLAAQVVHRHKLRERRRHDRSCQIVCMLKGILKKIDMYSHGLRIETLPLVSATI
jgi:hypothetical protein